jgi:hypothetical protein
MAQGTEINIVVMSNVFVVGEVQVIPILTISNMIPRPEVFRLCCAYGYVVVKASHIVVGRLFSVY